MMLEGQAALVLGAARGVGRAAAVALAREGANVAVAGIRPERLSGAAEEVEAAGARALRLGCDISNEDEVAAAVDRTCETFGRLDVVVNSAVWMDPPVPLLETPRDVWDRTIAVDLTGAFLLSKHALRAMKARGTGRLIHISSEIARRGSSMRGAYAIAKAGLNCMVQSLALSLAGTDIKVNAICPMGIAGEHNRWMRDKFNALAGRPAETDEHYERVRAAMMQPEEVAALAVFLASPAGLRINGQLMTIGEPSSSG